MMGQLQNVPPEFVSWWLVIALALLGAAATGVTLWSNLRSRPPHEAPTRREFDGLVGKVSELERALPLMEGRMLAAVERMGDRLADKMDRQAVVAHETQLEVFQRLNENDKALARLEVGR